MNGSCDQCYWCIDVNCTTIAIPGSGTTGGTNWPPDPPLNPGSGGSGGGSSNPPTGGGNCTGTNNCGQLRSLIIEGRVPCGGCGPGPVIVIPPEDEPQGCDDFMTILKNDSTFSNRFHELTSTTLLTKNYETGYYIASRANGSYTQMQGNAGSPHILLSGATLLMDGYIHNHTVPLNQAPMFSVDDILMMAEAFLKGKVRDSSNFFIGVAHNYGPPYLLKITNTAKFRKFAEKIIASESSAKEKRRFSNLYQNNFRSANTNLNEKEFLDMLKEQGTGNGIGLYRAEDNNCKKWIKLERDNFNTSGISETHCH